MKKGFTLIEMLVVIGIIAIISAASMGGYSYLVRSADMTRANELVSNVSTALAILYQRDGMWPKRLVVAAEGDNLLDEAAALALAKKNSLSLDMKSDGCALEGYDRFGVVTPWATTTIKERGKSATKTSTVGNSKKTIEDHTLRFAIDLDGDGFTELPPIEGYNGGKKVRAVACVWCCSKEGSLKYRDLIRSWTDGQVVK